MTRTTAAHDRFRSAARPGISLLVGIALAIAYFAHVLAPALDATGGWPYWPVLIIGLAALFVPAVYLLLTRVLGPTLFRRGNGFAAVLVFVAFAGGTLLASRGVPLKVEWQRAQSRVPAELITGRSWGEHHLGYEMHAPIPGDASITSALHAALPENVRRFGGRIHLRVAQPEWSVFDSVGTVLTGGDGVDIRIMEEHGGGWTNIRQLHMNAHENPAQRVWIDVTANLARGSRAIAVEVRAGPPGSNNWFDRALVAPRLTPSAESFIAVFDAIAFAFVLLIAASALLLRNAQASSTQRGSCGKPEWAARTMQPVGFRVRMLDLGFLAAITAVFVAPYIAHIGFYADDWLFATFFNFNRHATLADILATFPDARLFPLFFEQRIFGVLGFAPLGHQILNTTLLLACTCMLYLVLEEFGLSRTVSLATAVVYSLLPHASTNRFLIAAFGINLSVFLCLLAIYSDFRLLRGTLPAQLGWKALGLIALLASVLCYEITIPFFLLSAVVVWKRAAAARERDGFATPSRRRLAILLTTNLLALTSFLFYRLTTSTRLSHEISFSTQVIRNLGRAFSPDFAPAAHGFNLGRALDISFGDWGLRVPAVLWRIAGGGADPVLLLIALALGLAIAGWFFRIMDVKADERPGRNAFDLMLAGLGLFVLGYSVFLGNDNITLTPTGIGNRTAAMSAIGVAISFVGAFGWVSGLLNRPSRRNLLFAVSIGAMSAAGFLINANIAEHWKSAYKQGQVILQQAKHTLPQLPDNAAVLLDGVCPYDGPATIFETPDFMGALQLGLKRQGFSADVVTPRLTVSDDAIVTRIYVATFRYSFSNGILVYNHRLGQVFPLHDAAEARRYFSTYTPDFNASCPGQVATGAPIF